LIPQEVTVEEPPVMLAKASLMPTEKLQIFHQLFREPN
jgi:hypothetical protein